MNNLEVVLTPALLPLYDIKGKIVVVIDILRATSSICVAFQTGAERILPVATPEECSAYKAQGYICAAERGAKVVPGFDIGNSPYSYLNPEIKGKSIALTTTNGTHAINISRDADKVVVGSFLNIDFLAAWLLKQNKDVVLLCAGWNNKFNLEDTLFAGAMVKRLRSNFEVACDSGIAAEDLFNLAENDLYSYIQKSSHSHRFKDLGIEEDIAFCMQLNITSLIPVLEGNYLVKMKPENISASSF